MTTPAAPGTAALLPPGMVAAPTPVATAVEESLRELLAEDAAFLRELLRAPHGVGRATLRVATLLGE